MPIKFTIAELKKKIGPRKELNLNATGINYLDDYDVEKLSQLNNLVERLDLSDNRLDSIPESLCAKLTKLVALDLRANNLTMLPANIGQLSKLKFLDAYGNELTDLPNSLAQLVSLNHLDLASNRFEGELREFINDEENEALPPQKFANKLRAFLDTRARKSEKQKQEKALRSAVAQPAENNVTVRNGKKAKAKKQQRKVDAEPELERAAPLNNATGSCSQRPHDVRSPRTRTRCSSIMGFIKDVMVMSLIMAFVLTAFSGYALYRNCADKKRFLPNSAGFCADANKLIKKGEWSETLWKNTNAAEQQLFIISINEAIKFKNYVLSSQFGHNVQSYAQNGWTVAVDVLLKVKQFFAGLVDQVNDWYAREGHKTFGKAFEVAADYLLKAQKFFAGLIAGVKEWYDREGEALLTHTLEKVKLTAMVALEVLRDVAQFVYARASYIAHWVYDAALLLVNDSDKFLEKIQRLYS
uniref:Leucine-rich repeat-containing protein 59 n=1 Tax=Steinernema glaseri TaxID=37863 RepID=A0A1I7YUD5_9BILA